MFVQIPGYPMYLIDENGIVVSTRHGKWRVLKPATIKAGYHRVDFWVNGKNKHMKIHRLVMLTWVGPSELHVNHKNGCKTDNRLENLEYVTELENARHAWKTGLNENARKQGQQHPRAKLSDVDAAKLLALKGTMFQKEAAKLFGIGQQHVARIWSGERRKHLQEE